MRVWCARLLAALVVLMAGTVAQAEGEDLVLLLMDSDRLPERPNELRLLAELQAVGFQVKATRHEGTEGDAMRDLLLQQRAFGAVALGEEGEVVSARAWVLDPRDEALTEAPFRADASGGGELSLQVAEFLHGRRLEGPALAKAPVSETPPQEVGAHRAWALASSLGGGASGLGMHGYLSVAGRWYPLEPLALDLEAVVSTDTAIARAVGSADLRYLVVRGGASWVPFGDSFFAPALGGGLGLLTLVASGDAEAPAQGRSDYVSVPLLFAKASLGLRLDARLRLRVSASLGRMVPEIEVRFSGDRVGSGSLIFDTLVGLEWEWSEIDG